MLWMVWQIQLSHSWESSSLLLFFNGCNSLWVASIPFSLWVLCSLFSFSWALGCVEGCCKAPSRLFYLSQVHKMSCQEGADRAVHTQFLLHSKNFATKSSCGFPTKCLKKSPLPLKHLLQPSTKLLGKQNIFLAVVQNPPQGEV